MYPVIKRRDTDGARVFSREWSAREELQGVLILHGHLSPDDANYKEEKALSSKRISEQSQTICHEFHESNLSLHKISGLFSRKILHPTRYTVLRIVHLPNTCVIPSFRSVITQIRFCMRGGFFASASGRSSTVRGFFNAVAEITLRHRPLCISDNLFEYPRLLLIRSLEVDLRQHLSPVDFISRNRIAIGRARGKAYLYEMEYGRCRAPI